MSQGGPAGVDMGRITSMQQNADGFSAGQNEKWMHWLFGCDLHGKRLINAMEECMQWNANKMILPVQQIMPVPAAGMALGSLAPIRQLLEILKQGGNLQDFAFDVSAEMESAAMEARSWLMNLTHDISAPDGSASVSMQALGALRNQAMHQAAIQGGADAGMSV